MKLQLTKTKTIDINFPGGGKAALGMADVTGVLLNSRDTRGVPAVRLRQRKGNWQVVAAGFVPPPEGTLPDSWEALSTQQKGWVLPPEFQAPHAAIAIDSPAVVAQQTTPDALPADQRNPAQGPVSAEGMRLVTVPLAEAPFVLQCGLPEYQVLWAARHLPEGRRPTACSVQAMQSAMLSSICSQPDFSEGDGNAFVIYVLREAIYLAAYREGQLLMFRQCPGVAGWEMLREGVKLRLGVDEEMVDAILDDVLIDPRSAMDPFVRPVLQQLEISLDYLASRHEMRVDKVFLMGLPSGSRYWSQMAEEALHMPLVTPNIFEGMALPQKDTALAQMTPGETQAFLTALGAARAAMEGNA